MAIWTITHLWHAGFSRSTTLSNGLSNSHPHFWWWVDVYSLTHSPSTVFESLPVSVFVWCVYLSRSPVRSREDRQNWNWFAVYPLYKRKYLFNRDEPCSFTYSLSTSNVAGSTLGRGDTVVKKIGNLWKVTFWRGKIDNKKVSQEKIRLLWTLCVYNGVCLLVCTHWILYLFFPVFPSAL